MIKSSLKLHLCYCYVFVSANILNELQNRIKTVNILKHIWFPFKRVAHTTKFHCHKNSESCYVENVYAT